MKIFVLLSRIPWPLEKGDKLRAYNQVRCLAKQNEIILCALNTDPNADKQKAFKALQPYCRSINFIDLGQIGIATNLVKAWINGKPLQTGYFYNRKAHHRINHLLDEYQPDIIYGQLLRVAEYIRHSSLPKAIDYQDVFSMGMKRRFDVAPFFMKPFFKMEYKRLSIYEAAIFDDFPIKTIISKPDRDLIPHKKRKQIIIVPNGVDHDFFKPLQADKKYDIVFTGNMAYPPNVNAAEFLVKEIMPLVWKKQSNIRLMLAGATPDKRVRVLQSEKVYVSGWMDDIRNAYASSRFFIAPMQIGTGLQNKLLEAMSMRLPCITTPLANAALEGVHGKELLIGTTASELAENILLLVNNKETAARIADSGYEFVHQKYDWAKATSLLENEMKAFISK
jgi:glycosyltransferase involved in cell wall biosynthesis